MDEPTQTREGEPRPSRRRRKLLLLALALVALPLLVLIAALGSLRVDSVRQAVLGRLSSYLAEEFKLAFSARDFDVGWGGRFEITGVRVGAPGAPPLVTAERVRGAVDLWTLRSPVLGLRYVEVESPRLDLAAPIPEVPSDEPSGPPGFEIRRLSVRDGAIVGAPTEGALAEWVTAWRADGLGASGSFRDGVWDVNVEQGRATVERPGFSPLVARLAGRLSYKDGAPVTFRDVRAEGDGLRLAASGSVGLDPGASSSGVAATFDATVEPRLLTAGTPPGGRIHARGDVRLPEATGRVSLTAEAVPAEVARPYLDGELFADLSLAGTVADARADLTAGPG
ncbi:MAG TPA: hypothetical protein VEL74_05105, partial [Thermoanaerobaculia bacterium]|nr:hypothetical protein [Thermoanaerobaculia bacterium]